MKRSRDPGQEKDGPSDSAGSHAKTLKLIARPDTPPTAPSWAAVLSPTTPPFEQYLERKRLMRTSDPTGWPMQFNLTEDGTTWREEAQQLWGIRRKSRNDGEPLTIRQKAYVGAHTRNGTMIWLGEEPPARVDVWMNERQAR